MLRRLFQLCVLMSLGSVTWAQTHTQTAREALIEMFSGSKPEAFERHLLKETALRIHQLTSEQQQQFQMSRAMVKSGGGQNEVIWFGDGPVLVSYTDPKTSTKFEVVVEKDEPGDGTEEMEFSFRSNGTAQKGLSSLVPRLLVSMKQEDDTWKLAEIGFSMKVKLDAALLDSFAEKLAKPVATASPAAGATPAEQAHEITAASLSSQERASVAGVRSLVAAEQAYRMAFPARGYTCSLASLGGQGDGNATEDRAGLIDANLESGTLEGYRLSLLGCRGDPVVGFKLMAVPEGAGRYGKRAFCTDESGVVKFSDDGRGITCLTEKNVLK